MTNPPALTSSTRLVYGLFVAVFFALADAGEE